MRRHDAVLVKDCAQAHGTTYRSVPIGSFGSAGCFSLYPTKNTTTGEGGMVVANEVAARCRSFIDHDRAPDGGHERVDHSFRVTDIRAAIGRVQLGRLDSFVAVEDAAVLVLGMPTAPGTRHANRRHDPSSRSWMRSGPRCGRPTRPSTWWASPICRPRPAR